MAVSEAVEAVAGAVAVVGQAIEGEIIAEKIDIDIEVSLKGRIEEGRDQAAEQGVGVGRKKKLLFLYRLIN